MEPNLIRGAPEFLTLITMARWARIVAIAPLTHILLTTRRIAS